MIIEGLQCYYESFEKRDGQGNIVAWLCVDQLVELFEVPTNTGATIDIKLSKRPSSVSKKIIFTAASCKVFGIEWEWEDCETGYRGELDQSLFNCLNDYFEVSDVEAGEIENHAGYITIYVQE